MNSIPLTTDDDVTPDPNNLETRTWSTLNAIRCGGKIETKKYLKTLIFQNFHELLKKLLAHCSYNDRAPKTTNCGSNLKLIWIVFLAK